MNQAATSGSYLILDNVAGWRDSHRCGLALTKPGADLVLEPLPGFATPLLDEKLEEQFVCPSALATNSCGWLLVVDTKLHLVKRLDLARLASSKSTSTRCARIEVLPAVGPEGSAPRRLRTPRGVAALPSGDIAVADTGNHRIQVFSRAAYGLLQVWGAAAPLGAPLPGNGRKEFRHPWAIAADRCGTVYVVDRGNRRIQRIAHDGTWLGEFGAAVLKDPTRIALGPNGVVAVVDMGVGIDTHKRES